MRAATIPSDICTVAGGVEIGRHLQQAKDIAGHGGWLDWLQSEFEWSESTALRFVRLYRAVCIDKSVKMTDLVRLRTTVAALVVAPGTPQAARDEVIYRVKQGEHVGVREARQVIVHTQAVEQKPTRLIVPVYTVQQSSRILSADDPAPDHASELGRWLRNGGAIPSWALAEHDDDDCVLAAAVAKLSEDDQAAMGEIIDFAVRLSAARRRLGH
jgi:hypothetical protein